MSDAPDRDDAPSIAIIGMGGRFPGADSVEAFWENLRAGVESVTAFTDQELLDAGVSPDLLANPHYVKSGCVLDSVDQFDAGLFGFSPRDAAIMDPQHRLFLECAWTALEHSGHDPAHFAGSIGVFAGSGYHAYLASNLLSNPQLVDELGFFAIRHTSNDKDFLATRVSYQLNLKGPSINVQTACSTSLVAVHMACQSLLNGESDMALAGGVTINLPHRVGYLHKQNEILSPDGHCRAFDAASEGTIFGSGAGVVVLRRLDDALEAGDYIHAVIRGSAVNNDGSTKVSYLAPSVDGQAGSVAEALAVAGVEPDSISYIEAHGTGTRMGDPIEIAALTQAFRARTNGSQFCAIGSVKTNIGHLDSAAGVAGLIKTVLALEHREIPPSLHYERPNPSIEFERSPFFVNAALRPWAAGGGPRRAGVNSLGVGGTNAHVVVEEAPERPSSSTGRPWHVLPLAARSKTALDAMSAALAAHLDRQADVNIADVAHTLQCGRHGLRVRRTVVCRDRAEAVRLLRTPEPSLVSSGSAVEGTRSVAFMFAGGGAQYPGMGRDLYDAEPVYREAIEACLSHIRRIVDFDLRPLLFPAPGSGEAAAAELQRPSRALPALLAVQYAQAKLWESWGFEPDAMIGHSMGEYTAACLAGVFSLRDALAVVHCRGRLFEQLPAGSMLGVLLPVEQVAPLLGPTLSLAAVNAPELCVVSGPSGAIDELAERLTSREIGVQRIHIAVAAHSAMLEPILQPFREFMHGLTLRPPTRRFVSNLSGNWITAEEATSPDYWVRHLRHTVRFADGMRVLLDDPNRVLLEVGPGKTLATLAQQHSARRSEHAVVQSMRHPKDTTHDVAVMLNALGRLWIAGSRPHWAKYYGTERRLRVPLPTYPFERKSHWIAPGARAHASGASSGGALARLEMDRWFYAPSWRQTVPPQLSADDLTGLRGTLVPVFADAFGFGDAVCTALRSHGARVVTIRPGPKTQFGSGDAWQINPEDLDGYEQAISLLSGASEPLRLIVHLWNVGAGTEEGRERDARGTEEARKSDVDLLAGIASAFFSPLYLAKALAASEGGELRVVFVTNRGETAGSREAADPLKALLKGPALVMEQEIPRVRTRTIDIDPQWTLADVAGGLASGLIDDIVVGVEPTVAWRGMSRLARAFDPVQLAGPNRTRLREGGAYIITGGLGGLALVLAEHLVARHRARVMLVARQAMPPKEEWRAIAGSDRGDAAMRARVTALLGLEALGGEVEIAQANVTDAAALRAVLTSAAERFGRIDGVFHTAGTIGDNLIQLKDATSAARVLAPKVEGTLALEEALEGQDVDFVMLFSSISAVAGLQGQVDYTAANAFLDAFAQDRFHRRRWPVISVNWPAWRDAGMAASLAAAKGFALDERSWGPASVLRHAVFERRRMRSDGAIELSTTLGGGRHWMLDEHRTASGTAVLPGTGYLALAHSALEQAVPDQRLRIKDVIFLVPFRVQGAEPRELRVELQPAGHEWELVISSAGSIESGDAETTTVHVRASAEPVSVEPPRTIAVTEIRSRCTTEEPVENRGAAHRHMRFGPRWANVLRMSTGTKEALVELALPDEAASDLEALSLHPALLDMATGFAQRLANGEGPLRDFFVPLGYGSLRVHAPLEARIYSHVRLREGAGDTIAFDVDICGASGRVLVEVERFAMKRTAQGLDGPESAGPAATRQAPERGDAPAGGHSVLDLGMRTGLRREEGMLVIERALTTRHVPQLLVSPVDLEAYLAALRGNARTSADTASETVITRSERPELDTPFAAAQSDLERELIGMWEIALGISGVGVDDDFFQLGGHSLLLTQIATRARRHLGASVDLGSLFERPTVRQWAQLMEDAKARPEAAAKPTLKRVSREAYRVS